MASILKIKRSTGSAPPSSLASGELAYAWDESGGFANGKLYVGTGSESGGAAANVEIIGGKYFTNLLDHTLGTLQPSSALLTDSSSKLQQLKVDNLDFDGNAITSTNTNGDISITPNGTGKSIITNLYTDASTSLSAYITSIAGGTLTFVDGEGIDISKVGNTVTISGELASTTNIGSASFNNANFVVTSGDVTTKTITLGTSTLNNGSTTSTLQGLQQLTVDNVDINDNTITTTNTNGNLVLSANGTGNISVSSKRIINVATPTSDTDAANKAYVDSARSGLDVKASVRAATTANITLIGTQTVDDIALNVEDRVLVKDQTTASQNGIYVVQSGAWTRASDADNSPSGEVTSGMFTFVEQGTVNQNTGFVLATTGTITLGTTGLTFTIFSTSGTLIAGAGLVKSGDTLAVQTGGGIEISSDTVQLASTVAGAGLTLTSGILAVVGTTDRIVANADSIDIASTYVGQGSITTLGTITTGVWNGTTVAVGYGGTGITTATSRGILYGNGTSAMSVTAASTIDGSFLRGDASGAPYWSNVFDGGTY